MKVENIEFIIWILGIVGVFITLSLSINAIILKGIYHELILLKLSTNSLIVDSVNREKRISNCEENDKEIFQRINKIEKQV